MTAPDAWLSIETQQRAAPVSGTQPPPIQSAGSGWGQRQVLDPESPSSPWRQVVGGTMSLTLGSIFPISSLLLPGALNSGLVAGRPHPAHPLFQVPRAPLEAAAGELGALGSLAAGTTL